MITNRLDEFPNDLGGRLLFRQDLPQYSPVWEEWFAIALDGHIVYGLSFDACRWNLISVNRAISKHRASSREEEVRCSNEGGAHEQCSL
jgi:hypothetical protein